MSEIPRSPQEAKHRPIPRRDFLKTSMLAIGAALNPLKLDPKPETSTQPDTQETNENPPNNHPEVIIQKQGFTDY